MPNQVGPTRRSRAAKQREVERLSELLAGSRLIAVLRFSGINAPKTQELRRVVREAGGRYRVVKNSLLRRALGEQGSPLADLPHESCAVLCFADEPLQGWARFDRYLELEFSVLIHRKRRGPSSTQEGMMGQADYRRDPMRAMVNELEVLGLSLDGERIERETLARLVALGGEAGVRAALLRQLSASPRRMLALLQTPARSCLAVMRARR